MAVRADDIPVPRGRPRLTGRVREWLDQESILGPVFVTPALLLLVLLVAYPFLMALYFAMSNAFIGRPSEFIGIRNFVRLWDSDAFRQTFQNRSEEHTSELQPRPHLVCRLLLQNKKRAPSICHGARIRSTLAQTARRTRCRRRARPRISPACCSVLHHAASSACPCLSRARARGN